MARLPYSRAPLLAATAALTALAAALAPGLAGAQELSGVALGPEGEPLTETPVVLHRVGGGGGAFVATETTTSDGRFRFVLEEADSAIYFVALRHDDRVYIGPAVQAGAGPSSGYVLRVEPGSEAGAVASALSGQAPASPAAPSARGTGAGGSDAGAFVLVALLAFATVAAFLVAAPRYRHRRTRDALIELATVENALADPEPAGDLDRLLATRDRLRKQLAPGG